MARTRECNDPEPRHGGSDCIGEDYKEILCTSKPLLDVPFASVYCNSLKNVLDGAWTPWANMNQCANNEISQARSCSDPEPWNGGEDCEGDSERTLECHGM